MNLVNLMNPRSQTRWRDRRTWKKGILPLRSLEMLCVSPCGLNRRLRSKQPPFSVEPEEGVESKSTKARVNVSELLHDAFLAKAA